jgi:hypothetical protein
VSFAGTAYTWRDAEPLAGGATRALSFVPATAQAPIFQVISPQEPSPDVVYFSRAGA